MNRIDENQRHFLMSVYIWQTHNTLFFLLSKSREKLIENVLLTSTYTDSAKPILNEIRDKYLKEYDEITKRNVPEFGETFNENEMRHIAVNYAITCQKGYTGSFEKWYSGIVSDWRTIANKMP